MLKKTTLKALFKLWDKGSFSVVFWDGEEVYYGSEKAVFKIIFHKEPTLNNVKKDLILTLGEAYMDGIIDFEGSLDDVIATLFKNNGNEAKADFHLKDLTHQLKEIDEAIESKNIHKHYDLGNDFFALWLDKTMSYSCAYFKTEKDTLEQAQLQKIDHSLKKLNLTANEHLLDIGCGWGWLAIRAAQQYKVYATGITLSKEQYEGARARVHELGLDELVDIRLANYMDMNPKQERFDKIVSIGMFEHVGKKYLPLYFSKVNALLKDKGTFLLHSIMSNFESPTNSWIKTYIFPGGYVPTLRETIQLLPEFDFHVLHTESLRLHYAKTLDCWNDNFQQKLPEVRKLYDERFIRMWGLYLTGCASAFRTGGIDIYQCLLTKGIDNNIPMTADYMYK